MALIGGRFLFTMLWQKVNIRWDFPVEGYLKKKLPEQEKCVNEKKKCQTFITISSGFYKSDHIVFKVQYFVKEKNLNKEI